MSVIKAPHNLLDPSADPARNGPVPKRSKYFYLFEDLANDEGAGLFPGTTEEETILRLKDFEIAYGVCGGSDEIKLMQLPAAYTYFGQFLNHDISAPVVVLPGQTNTEGVIGPADPPGLEKVLRAAANDILDHFENEHDQPMTLASLYGDGPQRGDSDIKSLYEPDGMSFVLGETYTMTHADLKPFEVVPANLKHRSGAKDIPRGKDPRGDKDIPLIADRRNDGNLILSQLHLAFLIIHNQAVKLLKDQFKGDPAACFDAARVLVTRHYHWLILNDFLPSLLSETVLRRPLAEWVIRTTVHRTQAPRGLVPMEFTTAAFRFGHSMVGASYDFNENFGAESGNNASLDQLFDFTSRKNMGGQGGEKGQLPDHWVIDWDRMTAPPRKGAGGAEQIDLNLARVMLTSVGEGSVLAHSSIMLRNLLRGFRRRIPFGQVLAREYGLHELEPEQIEAALPDQLAFTPDGYRTVPADTLMTVKAISTALGIHENTPAWLYMLVEAQLDGGQRLGPTASHIIADTIIGLMRRNPASVLNYKNGHWHPRDSVFRDKDDKEIDSIRAFLLFSTEGIIQGRQI